MIEEHEKEHALVACWRWLSFGVCRSATCAPLGRSVRPVAVAAALVPLRAHPVAEGVQHEQEAGGSNERERSHHTVSIVPLQH